MLVDFGVGSGRLEIMRYTNKSPQNYLRRRCSAYFLADFGGFSMTTGLINRKYSPGEPKSGEGL